ncbi:MAG: hypothetical protein N4A61_10715 [Pelagimonas sp.]|nr:hypothetical protein [Pelagimonas sp.]
MAAIALLVGLLAVPAAQAFAREMSLEMASRRPRDGPGLLMGR